MVNPNRFYTYAYLREDRTPYYIGKGQGKRLYKKGKGEVKPPKDKSRIIFLKQNLTEEDAFKHERYMIAVFGRKDLGTGILHNKSDGGEGPSGWVASEETRRKMSEVNIGKTLSEEHKKSLFEGRSNYIFTDEVKKRISNTLKEKNIKPPSRKGIKHNQQYFDKRCKKLYEITSPEGEIFITNRMKNFCEINSLNCGNMRQVSNGKFKQYKGWTVKILEQKP
jgi:hypothetical protein